MPSAGIAPRRRYQSKHLDQRRVPISSVPLGIDWSQNPENIPDGAAATLENWEYINGALRTARGLSVKVRRYATTNRPLISADLDLISANDGVIDDSGDDIQALFVLNGKRYYSAGKQLLQASDSAHIADLTGDKQPIYTTFGGRLIIASGGQLQAFDGTTMLTTKSPATEWVSDFKGRVLCFRDDDLVFSRVGDCLSDKSWEHDTNDVSSCQRVPIGYQDPGNITAVDVMGDTIIIHKASGRIYAMTGGPNAPNIREVVRNVTCLSKQTALSIMGKAYFIARNGLFSVNPTQDYDELRPQEDGLAVNGLMSQELDESCKMWHVPSCSQVWIKGQGTRVYIYHYTPIWPDGRGAVTTRTLTSPLHDVKEIDGKIYLAYGNKIAVLDGTTDKDDGQQIQAVFMGKAILPPRRNLLIKNRSLLVRNILPGNGVIQIGKKIVSRTWKSLTDGPLVAADIDLVDSSGSLYADDYTRWRKAGGGGCKRLQPSLIVNSGSIELRALDFEYVEV